MWCDAWCCVLNEPPECTRKNTPAAAALVCSQGHAFTPARLSLVYAQDILDHLPAVDTPAGALPWQMRSIPGLGAPANSSGSSGGSGSSSAASIPWRLRQVEAVELPPAPAAAAAAAAGGADGPGPVSDAVLTLAGGGRVRAGAVGDVPLEDVPDLEVRWKVMQL
jgi:hypothetical protein